MEIVLFFALGYFIGSLRHFGKVDLKKPDRVLRWDEDVFGWRPVIPGATLKENETILFAYEMKKNENDEER